MIKNTYTPANTGMFLQSQYVTPDNKYYLGQDSSGGQQVAPFLPLGRYDMFKHTYVVISSGKPVAFLDKFLVPAGLRLELEAVKGGAPATYVYSKEDVKNKIRNYAGNLVTNGEAVATSILAANADVSGFAGIANYDYFRQAGGDGQNPVDYNFSNYNAQAQVSYNMQYVYQYPATATQDLYDAAPFEGIATFLGKTDTVKPGQFVTYDKYSNFVVAAADFTTGDLGQDVLVGQILRVDTVCDPADNTKVINPVNSADLIISAQNSSGNILNDHASVSNGGVPQKIFYANGHGYVTFKLNTR